MSTSMYNIEKLTDTNYDSWSLLMRSVLFHQDLWSIASGDEVKPEANDAAGQAALAVWNKKDSKATATIILSATPSQIAHVKNCTTSQEVWCMLKEIHHPRGPVRKVTLFKQLLAMRMDENESVQQYLCKFTSVVDKLAEIGVTLQEELFVIMLMASLPKCYENFVVALETRDDLPNLSALKIKLTEEGQRRKASNGETCNEDSREEAFMIRTNNSKRQQFLKKNNDIEAKNTKASTQRTTRFKCYNCGRKGHYAAQCKDKKKDQTHASFSVSTISSNNVLDASSWCIDSGATAHLCSKREMFESFRTCYEIICLADNKKLKAEGVGKVRIRGQSSDVMLNDVLFVPGLRCNFISVGKAVKNDYTVEFSSKAARIVDKNGEIILKANKVGDLFLFNATFNQLFFTCNENAIKWHNRYGHMNCASLKQLVNKDMVRGLNVKFPDVIDCQGKKIKILRSDNGTEFDNCIFDEYLKKYGIKRQLTEPHTPQQNGVAERFNRTLVEMARSMIVGADADEYLWAEAVNTAAYLRNRAPTKAVNGKTPYEMMFKRKPNVFHLRTFGAIAIGMIKTHHGKFKPKGKEYVMVGYSDESKAYRLMDRTTRKIIVSRDVSFVEPDVPIQSIDVTIEAENTSRCY